MSTDINDPLFAAATTKWVRFGMPKRTGTSRFLRLYPEKNLGVVIKTWSSEDSGMTLIKFGSCKLWDIKTTDLARVVSAWRTTELPFLTEDLGDHWHELLTKWAADYALRAYFALKPDVKISLITTQPELIIKTQTESNTNNDQQNHEKRND